MTDESNATPVAVGDAPVNEPKAFEAWAGRANYSLNSRLNSRQVGDDVYISGVTNAAWDGWMARAARASQAAPDTTTTAYNPEFVRNKFADYETQILNLREELAAHEGSQAIPVTQDAQQASEHHRWRPIATAPRDGTSVLIRYGSDGISQAKYIAGVPYPWQFIDTNDGITWLINHARDGEAGPSHWMPLPSGDLVPLARPDAAKGESA